MCVFFLIQVDVFQVRSNFRFFCHTQENHIYMATLSRRGRLTYKMAETQRMIPFLCVAISVCSFFFNIYIDSNNTIEKNYTVCIHNVQAYSYGQMTK